MCWKNFGYSSRSTHSTFTIFWIFNAAGEALLRACCWQLDDDEQIPCKVAPLAACQCLSPVTCRSSPALALALALTLTATLMQCSRCQRVLCVLYHIPCYVIQRPQGRKRRRVGAWLGGRRESAAAFNVRSWQWNNIKLCLYICNAAAASTSSLPPAACAARAPWCMQLTSAAHSAQAPSPSLPLLSWFFFIKNSFFCVLFTLTFHLCLLMQLQIVWHTRTVKVLSGFARFDK